MQYTIQTNQRGRESRHTSLCAWHPARRSLPVVPHEWTRPPTAARRKRPLAWRRRWSTPRGVAYMPKVSVSFGVPHCDGSGTALLRGKTQTRQSRPAGPRSTIGNALLRLCCRPTPITIDISPVCPARARPNTRRPRFAMLYGLGGSSSPTREPTLQTPPRASRAPPPYPASHVASRSLSSGGRREIVAHSSSWIACPEGR